jgi:hypothetical protein
MKPKAKAERKVQFKMSIDESIAKTFDAHRKEADQLGYDWTATILDPMLKADTEFSQFLAKHPAKVQPESGLTRSPKPSSSNGGSPAEHRTDE